jgi:predicted nucleotidyltransferase
MMNIKILEPIPESEVIVTLPFGSHVYGTATENSDRDFVKIIKEDTGNLILQYEQREPVNFKTGDNIILMQKTKDYIYVSERHFWNKLQDGGNTVFFEALHTPEAKLWLASRGLYPEFQVLMDCYHSRMAKGYLGLAKRDLTYPGREKHVARSIWMAEKIIKKELIDLASVAKIPPLTGSIPEIAQRIAELRKGLKYG